MMDIQLKNIKSFLEEKGYECLYIDNPSGDYLFIDTLINGQDFRLKCIFPSTFPYCFPKIAILEEFYKEYKPLPHIDNSGCICTFDTNKVYPNSDKPEELTLHTLEQAINVIKDGITGANKEDFLDEFSSYWGLDSKINADIIFSPTNEPLILTGYRVNNKYICISNDDEKLSNYIKIIKRVRYEKSRLIKVLYLPIDKEFSLPLPQTNEDVISFLKDSKFYSNYINFLKDNSSVRMILFSQCINGNMCIEGWQHQKRKTPKGFRHKNVNPELLYEVINRQDELIKISTNQLAHSRTFRRGGDGNIKDNLKVLVIGCGSIGSNLVKSLVDIGVKDFTLIDNDILTSENIARHYCGASYLNKHKVEAIKEELIRHYVDIDCNVHRKNVFNLVLNEDYAVFNNCDYNFVVTGSLSVERKFLDLFKDGLIEKPIILIWVEPYLIGGHALILQEQEDVEKYLYDEEYNFRHRIVLNGSDYISKEAGCESTYLPYSSFEVQYFLATIVDFININIFEKSKKGNYLVSWCGRIDNARKNKMKLNSKWLSSKNREMRMTKINELD